MLGSVGTLSAQESDVQTLSGFSVPEYDENGNMTSQLFGDYAEFMPNGMVRITNLKIEFYEEGEVEMRVTAPQCTYNEKKKMAESESSVRIARGNMVVTGTGFRWRAGNERLEITSNARVVLKNLRKKLNTGEES
jgi:lipopolysaccharide export system protein LptC